MQPHAPHLQVWGILVERKAALNAGVEALSEKVRGVREDRRVSVQKKRGKAALDNGANFIIQPTVVSEGIWIKSPAAVCNVSCCAYLRPAVPRLAFLVSFSFCNLSLMCLFAIQHYSNGMQIQSWDANLAE